ncbi:hypothetical protein LCGC14_0589690 [marine sediment metagenome]|uniref:Uncharacterized protein n=1 Tax=marine sediment metagenome TaxID=412755 RepID=A0A0F9RDT6_9ZZZZ
MNQCENQCDREATRRIAFGMCAGTFARHTRHVVHLCDPCVSRLWSEIGRLCGLGMAHWTELTEQPMQLRTTMRSRIRSAWGRTKYILHECRATKCRWSDLANIWWESRVLRLE